MAGSAQVCANLLAYQFRKTLELKAAMDAHIQRSLAFAKTNHPWHSQSGEALSGLAAKTEFGGSEIISTIGGTNLHNWYMENPLDCIHPYGNPNAVPFGSRFRIIEQARDENLSLLWAECRAIMGRF